MIYLDTKAEKLYIVKQESQLTYRIAVHDFKTAVRILGENPLNEFSSGYPEQLVRLEQALMRESFKPPRGSQKELLKCFEGKAVDFKSIDAESCRRIKQMISTTWSDKRAGMFEY